MKSLKICTIGGGSSYTPELIEGFIKRYDELPVSDIYLVDCIEGKDKLNIVGTLAKRMVKEAGVNINIHLTLDLAEGLKDADFVTTQMRVGLLDARIKDEQISFKHGVLGQETNGSGGLFKALRTIPVILDICSMMERLCPNAWLINFTNPAGMVTEAVLRYSNIKKVVGLCNVPIGMEKGVCQALEVESHRVRVLFGGLNHMVYGLKIFLDGEDITTEALEKICKAETNHTMKNIDDKKFDEKLIKTLGVLPSPYHKYYYMHDEMYDKETSKGKTRGEVVKKVEDELFNLYKDETLTEKPKMLEERGGAFYSDAACNLISSIYNDKKDIQTVNTLNNGSITNLPYDSAVEVSAVITKDGPIPLSIGDLPVAVSGLVNQIKSFERIGCEAAVEGSRDKAFLAMVINPFIQSQKKANVILEEMLETHKKYLPRFFN